jgi:hypothetical protein
LKFAFSSNCVDITFSLHIVDIFKCCNHSFYFSRNIRAGSEAKSTPPVSRSKRVTRSSSVDPIGNLNDSVGTPVKRRTRASIVPTQPTVTEDEEIKNQDSGSLESNLLEINDDNSGKMAIYF